MKTIKNINTHNQHKNKKVHVALCVDVWGACVWTCGCVAARVFGMWLWTWAWCVARGACRNVGVVREEGVLGRRYPFFEKIEGF